MALIKCYECGKQISDAAPSCPGCGAPKKKEEEMDMSMRKISTHTPKCPLCGGTLMKMGGIEGVFRGGIAGAAKKHRCNSCGHLT